MKPEQVGKLNSREHALQGVGIIAGMGAGLWAEDVLRWALNATFGAAYVAKFDLRAIGSWTFGVMFFVGTFYIILRDMEAARLATGKSDEPV